MKYYYYEAVLKVWAQVDKHLTYMPEYAFSDSKEESYWQFVKDRLTWIRDNCDYYESVSGLGNTWKIIYKGRKGVYWTSGKFNPTLVIVPKEKYTEAILLNMFWCIVRMIITEDKHAVNKQHNPFLIDLSEATDTLLGDFDYLYQKQ